MAIAIDENILLGVAALIFLPVFIFFVKLIIEVGNIKARLDVLCEKSDSSYQSLEIVNEHESDIRIIKLRMDNVEKDIDHLVKHVNPESNYGRERRNRYDFDRLEDNNK